MPEFSTLSSTTGQDFDRQLTIAHLGKLALSNASMSELFTTTLVQLRSCLGVDFSSILVPNQTCTQLQIAASQGWPKTAIETVTVPLAETTQAGYTFLTRKAITTPDFHNQTRFRLHEKMIAAGVRSGASSVIEGEKRPYGVLIIHSTQQRTYRENEILFLESITNILAQAIQRKRLEQRRDEFINVASHELRTPLTSVKAFTQLLDRYLEKTGETHARVYVSKMQNQVDRLQQLVEDLLDISKINSGQFDFDQTTLNLDELVTAVIEEVQLTTKHTIVKSRTAPSFVFGDSYRLGQVITNLLTNAIKYSPRATQINVTLTATADTVVVAIQDFGLGIAKDKQKQLFQRFYRAEGKLRDSFPGLGLGLYISAEIIARHQGTIWMESEEDKGSTFFFSLPLVPVNTKTSFIPPNLESGRKSKGSR